MSTSHISNDLPPTEMEVGRFDGVRFIASIPGAREAVARCINECLWAYDFTRVRGRMMYLATGYQERFDAALRVGRWLATGKVDPSHPHPQGETA
jgi:hypothetical protein